MTACHPGNQQQGNCPSGHSLKLSVVRELGGGGRGLGGGLRQIE